MVQSNQSNTRDWKNLRNKSFFFFNVLLFFSSRLVLVYDPIKSAEYASAQKTFATTTNFFSRVTGSGGVEDTTLEAMYSKKKKYKAKNLLFEDRPSRGQEQKWSRLRTKDTIFLNYVRQIFYNFLSSKILKILHFVKFLMIIQI